MTDPDLRLGDCVEVMAAMPAGSVDAVVTDPPYGLEFMGKEWDAPWQAGIGIGGNNAGFEQFQLADGRTRQARPSYTGGTNPGCINCGGKKHGTDPTQRKVCACPEPRFQNVTLPRMVAFQAWCELWAAEALRVLKPGGHLLAFGGTRTAHRLVCAVEDAGFEIRDSIVWLYGSGFPKSLDVSKAIDKAAGAERGKHDVTVPVTADAKRWQGWGTALKPAHEPIVVARKPLAGTVAGNVLAYGTGGLNIDATRVGSGGQLKWDSPRDMGYHGGTDSDATATNNTVGRWPANVVLDESQAAALDRQSGTTTSRVGTPRGSQQPGDGWGMTATAAEYDDLGGASRFFYVAKAGSRERPQVDGTGHPTVKPLSLMRWLVRLVCPPGGTVLDPFLGSGTTAEACTLEGFDCIGVERDESYLELARVRLGKPIQPDIFGS